MTNQYLIEIILGLIELVFILIMASVLTEKIKIKYRKYTLTLSIIGFLFGICVIYSTIVFNNIQIGKSLVLIFILMLTIVFHIYGLKYKLKINRNKFDQNIKKV
ncbi:hypothetical protein HMPREF1092_03239 [Clostridium thermobutyricum]|uniref:Uncharacterized protein n=1 Tax=Clostridium thermobutyricum TaxID=29372 RepID=N9XTS3_9CLOT|nr:hypothetical protein [Clostridium thermobutyricum]ENY99353.1 hypothetical protein HMPREF1092_03239 [Clostridium thermobutyricum]